MTDESGNLPGGVALSPEDPAEKVAADLKTIDASDVPDSDVPLTAGVRAIDDGASKSGSEQGADVDVAVAVAGNESESTDKPTLNPFNVPFPLKTAKPVTRMLYSRLPEVTDGPGDNVWKLALGLPLEKKAGLKERVYKDEFPDGIKRSERRRQIAVLAEEFNKFFPDSAKLNKPVSKIPDSATLNNRVWVNVHHQDTEEHAIHRREVWKRATGEELPENEDAGESKRSILKTLEYDQIWDLLEGDVLQSDKDFRIIARDVVKAVVGDIKPEVLSTLDRDTIQKLFEKCFVEAYGPFVRLVNGDNISLLKVSVPIPDAPIAAEPTLEVAPAPVAEEIPVPSAEALPEVTAATITPETPPVDTSESVAPAPVVEAPPAANTEAPFAVSRIAQLSHDSPGGGGRDLLYSKFNRELRKSGIFREERDEFFKQLEARDAERIEAGGESIVELLPKTHVNEKKYSYDVQEALERVMNERGRELRKLNKLAVQESRRPKRSEETEEAGEERLSRESVNEVKNVGKIHSVLKYVKKALGKEPQVSDKSSPPENRRHEEYKKALDRKIEDAFIEALELVYYEQHKGQGLIMPELIRKKHLGYALKITVPVLGVAVAGVLGIPNLIARYEAVQQIKDSLNKIRLQQELEDNAGAQDKKWQEMREAGTASGSVRTGEKINSQLPAGVQIGAGAETPPASSSTALTPTPAAVTSAPVTPPAAARSVVVSTPAVATPKPKPASGETESKAAPKPDTDEAPKPIAEEPKAEHPKAPDDAPHGSVDGDKDSPAAAEKRQPPAGSVDVAAPPAETQPVLAGVSSSPEASGSESERIARGVALIRRLKLDPLRPKPQNPFTGYSRFNRSKPLGLLSPTPEPKPLLKPDNTSIAPVTAPVVKPAMQQATPQQQIDQPRAPNVPRDHAANTPPAPAPAAAPATAEKPKTTWRDKFFGTKANPKPDTYVATGHVSLGLNTNQNVGPLATSEIAPTPDAKPCTYVATGHVALGLCDQEVGPLATKPAPAEPVLSASYYPTGHQALAIEENSAHKTDSLAVQQKPPSFAERVTGGLGRLFGRG